MFAWRFRVLHTTSNRQLRLSPLLLVQEFDKAEEVLQKALELREHHLEENHPDIAVTLNELGLLYMQQRRYQVKNRAE